MPEPVVKIAAWEDFVLRGIGLFKIFKALITLSVAFGLREILHQHQDLDDVMRTYIIEPMHFDSENRMIKWTLDEAARFTTHNIRFLSYGAFFYAAVFATEGVGLYLRKHWAEYMVLVSTGALLPVEFYELYLKVAWWKVAVVTVNLGILFYLIHRLLLDSRLDSPRGRRLAAKAEARKNDPPKRRRRSRPVPAE